MYGIKTSHPLTALAAHWLPGVHRGAKGSFFAKSRSLPAVLSSHRWSIRHRSAVFGSKTISPALVVPATANDAPNWRPSNVTSPAEFVFPRDDHLS